MKDLTRKEFLNETLSEIESLSISLKRKEEKLKNEMEKWFHAVFTEPYDLPYESAEVGSQYIHGGRYDAREELYSEFEGTVPEHLIEELANKLEDKCSEWSKIPDPDGAQQKRIEQLTRLLEESEQSHNKQIEEKEMVSGIDDLIISGFVGWTVTVALDGVLQQIAQLEDVVSEKLNRLLQSPYVTGKNAYVTGKNALELALEYAKSHQEKKLAPQLYRAIKYFAQAGSQLNEPEQVHAYCLAGLCSFLCQDELARKHYFKLALQSLMSMQNNKYLEDTMLPGFGCTVQELNMALVNTLQMS